MEHQIVTTMSGEDWEQTMTVTFADSTIAALVLEDEHIIHEHGKRILWFEPPNSTCSRRAAVVELKDNTVTVTTTTRYGSQKCFYASTKDNEAELKELAARWQAKEELYLPAMRYFRLAARDFNDSLHKWIDTVDKELADLADKLEYLEGRIDGVVSKSAEMQMQLESQSNGLDRFDECIEALGKLYAGLRNQLNEHKARFHFWKR